MMVLSALIALLGAAHSANSAPTCLFPANTLTTSCAGACGSNEPCLAFPAASCQSSLDTLGRCEDGKGSEGAECSFECFNATTVRAGAQSMAFSVSRGTEARKWPTKTKLNELSVAELAISPDATDFFLVMGGVEFTSYYYTDRNEPKAPLRLKKGFLVNQTQITSAVIANFNVTTSIAQLSDYLPLSIKSLDLSNNFLPSLPADLDRFTNLEKLYLLFGDFPVVSRSVSNANVNHVNLFESRVSKFEAEFPNIESLKIEGTLLTEIPPVIFTFKRLKTLYLNRNPFVAPTVNRSQLAFLRAIPDLSLKGISPPSFQCSGSMEKVSELSICVTDDEKPTATESPNHESNNNGLAVALGCGLALLVVVAIGSFVWWWRRRKSQSSKRLTNTSLTDTCNLMVSAAAEGGAAFRAMPTAEGSGARILWTDEELLSHKISTDSVRVVRQLGSGATCNVWLVQHINGAFLAAKRPKPEVRRRNEALLKFFSEIKLNGVLVHPRVIRLVGITWTSIQDLQALFEYAPQGDLFDWLQRPSTDRKWSQHKAQIASDVAEALVYVHSFAPPVVHRDVKSRNVLLGQQARAKLCDFGSARYQSENATMTAGVGTIRWLAPEVITGQSDYDGKADIYSLGVLLSELTTHELPFANLTDSGGIELSDAAIIAKVARGELQLKFGNETAPEVVALAQKCLALDPATRPPATEVFHRLRQLTVRS